jgi:NTE family protein
VPLVLPPMTVAGRRYVDGGVRPVTNADPAGCDRVVVLAPVTFGIKRRQRIRHQLRTARSDVRSVIVSPDAGAQKAIPLERARPGAAGRCGDGWTRAGGG